MTERERGGTRAGLLARHGFADPARAERLIDSDAVRPLIAEVDAEALLADLATAADPDQALLLLDRLLAAASAQQRTQLSSMLAADEDTRRRLIDVLGMSEALGEFLARHPEQTALLADGQRLADAPSASQVRVALLHAVGADPDALDPVATLEGDAALDALRVAYRAALLGIATRDLSGLARVDDVAAWLTDLADAVLAAALAVAVASVPEPDRHLVRLAVIAMGKAGGRELNYVSDVDVIFVAEPEEGVDETRALTVATTIATALMRACSAATSEGTIWEVDPNLRPEGRQGALVRTLASHIDYYQRWAKTWEFQALLKARAAAGDLALGQAYVDAVQPFVWAAAAREGFVDDVQAMRRRVEENLPARTAEREIKLGPGGLRDIEFSVQLLQLVHGRSDDMLRSPNTLDALDALAALGYVGRDAAATLGSAYRFLRTLEHRIQLYRLRRTHVMPDDDADLRRLGRSLGLVGDPVGELTKQWRAHAREVRRLHEKLFYRPLLQAVARLDPGEARLTTQAAEQRLRALGYVDPAGALRHLEALTAGVSRRAAIQRTLLPVMLGWFADGPDPDAGLLGFRRVSDELGTTHWYLGLLRDESVAAERMARILSCSKYATELMLAAPEHVALLADDAELTPRPLTALLAEVAAAMARHDDPERAVASVRALRRRELLRIAAAQIIGTIDADAGAQALSDIAQAAIAGALQAAMAKVAVQTGETSADALPMRFAVIGMGRFGGRELGFGSDADVMFVYEPVSGADEEAAARAALAVATELRSLLMAPSNDPPLEIDADLRPEGKQGPLVRSLESYRAYYERWSAGWEAQALLRALPVAGDGDLAERFIAMVDPVRYPAGGLPEADLREIRRLKARMEAERLPRGADPTLHTKLGRGGLSDVEWVVQLLTMQHGAKVPSLRTTRTLDGLAAARDAGLLSRQDHDTFVAAWTMATAVRGAVMLARGSAGDMLPTEPRERATVAFILGYPLGESMRMVEDYRRVTRRARSVVERLFYGND